MSGPERCKPRAWHRVQADEAAAMLEEMQGMGFEPDSRALAPLVAAYGNADRLPEALEVRRAGPGDARATCQCLLKFTPQTQASVTGSDHDHRPRCYTARLAATWRPGPSLST